MTWTDAGHPGTALVALVVGALVGWFVPRLIALVPEPVPDPEEVVPDPSVSLPPAPEKVLYVDIAARSGVALRCALGTGVTAAILAASVGFHGALLVLLPLVPIGVALAVIDWHTTLLPTRVIAPSYGVVVLGVLLAGLVDGDRDSVVRAALGWLAMGGFFVVLWLVYPRGLGYGDVRLSGVLGIALGYLGWPELLVGMYGAFLIGGVGGALLGALKVFNRKRFPFGPFMLIGAIVGVACGSAVTSALGY